MESRRDEMSIENHESTQQDKEHNLARYTWYAKASKNYFLILGLTQLKQKKVKFDLKSRHFSVLTP